MERKEITLGIIGIGLIGGSIALELKNKKDQTFKIFGYDKNSEHQNKALKKGLIDNTMDYLEMGKKCDIIIISTPVDVAGSILKELLNQKDLKATVCDVGSIKAPICKVANTTMHKGNFVACHPIAGTEYSGPDAAVRELFKDKINIICNSKDSHAGSLEKVEEIFQSLGSKNIYMDASIHDKQITYVSHLSHISSFALALTVLRKNKEEDNIFPMAGSGLRSTVRLAKSSSKMWTPILKENKENMLQAIDNYIEDLTQLKEAIKGNSNEELSALIDQANEIGSHI